LQELRSAGSVVQIGRAGKSQQRRTQVERDTTAGEDVTLAAELRENALLLEAANGEEQTACWSR